MNDPREDTELVVFDPKQLTACSARSLWVVEALISDDTATVGRDEESEDVG